MESILFERNRSDSVCVETEAIPFEWNINQFRKWETEAFFLRTIRTEIAPKDVAYFKAQCKNENYGLFRSPRHTQPCYREEKTIVMMYYALLVLLNGKTAVSGRSDQDENFVIE